MLDTYRANRIAGLLAQSVQPRGRVLDIGCGGMDVACQVEKKLGVEVVGIDVINVKRNDMQMCLGKGERLPFACDSFDLAYIAFALHHTDNPGVILEECLRVSRRQVVIFEDVYSNWVELQLLKMFDWIGNRAISGEMPFPFSFKTEQAWLELAGRLGLRFVAGHPVRPVPWRPTRHRMLIFEKLHTLPIPVMADRRDVVPSLARKAQPRLKGLQTGD